jgi:hypothetical protein
VYGWVVVKRGRKEGIVGGVALNISLALAEAVLAETARPRLTPMRSPLAFLMRWVRRVVFPEPRKPERTVTGTPFRTGGGSGATVGEEVAAAVSVICGVGEEGGMMRTQRGRGCGGHPVLPPSPAIASGRGCRSSEEAGAARE